MGISSYCFRPDFTCAKRYIYNAITCGKLNCTLGRKEHCLVKTQSCSLIQDYGFLLSNKILYDYSSIIVLSPYYMSTIYQAVIKCKLQKACNFYCIRAEIIERKVNLDCVTQDMLHNLTFIQAGRYKIRLPLLKHLN